MNNVKVWSSATVVVLIFYVLLTISCNIHMIFNRYNYKLLWRIDLANFPWILFELLVFQILKVETCQSLLYHHQHVCFFFDPCFNCSCCCWIKKKISVIWRWMEGKGRTNLIFDDLIQFCRKICFAINGNARTDLYDNIISLL